MTIVAEALVRNAGALRGSMSNVIPMNRHHRQDDRPLPWPKLESLQLPADGEQLIAGENYRRSKIHREFRVRLRDDKDGVIEFSVFGYRSLRIGCMRALSAWSQFYPRHTEVQVRLNEVLARHVAYMEEVSSSYQTRCFQLWKERGLNTREMTKAWAQHMERMLRDSSPEGLQRRLLLLSVPNQLSIEVARAGQAGEWHYPWGDSESVYLKVRAVRPSENMVSKAHEWTLDVYRQGNDHTAEVSWFLFWRGIAEAARELQPPL